MLSSGRLPGPHQRIYPGARSRSPLGVGAPGARPGLQGFYFGQIRVGKAQNKILGGLGLSFGVGVPGARPKSGL